MITPGIRTIIVGTGGIGTGLVLRLVGDHSLGREESRAVDLLDARDYCKGHIVLDAVRRLTGSSITVVPVGAVGDDAAGARLRDEMLAVGLPLDHIRIASGSPTLFAISFSYPDGEGGNLTTRASASDTVSAEQARSAVGPWASGDGIAVALPEVPLEAREALLAAAPAGWVRAASFVPGELPDAAERMLPHLDLVALNADEARAMAGDTSLSADEAAREAARVLDGRRPGLAVVITAGARGSWSWDGATFEHAAVAARSVRGTAGAGDAHLAGVLAGLATGATLHDANRLAAVVSALSVESPHAISPELCIEAVRLLARERGVALPSAFPGDAA